MARTTINSLGIPDDTIISADLDYPLTDFSSTGIDDSATSTAITIDSSQNTTFAGTITSGDITISEGTPLLRIQDTDGTNQYTNITNGNGNTYFGSRNDTADGNILIGGYGGNSFTEFARWTAAGHLTQENNLTVLGAFTSLGIDDNATSTALTVTDSGIAATLTTAAQPNITSVGTLTGFTSTGIDDNATSTALTIDSSQNTTFAGTITSGDITISEGTPNLRIQDTDGTNQYTSFTNINGNTYFGSRNDSADGTILIGGYGGNSFTEFARWSDAGHLTQKNNLTVQGAFTSLGIDDNATSTAITIDSSERVGIKTTSLNANLEISGNTTTGGEDVVQWNNSAGVNKGMLQLSSAGGGQIQLRDAANTVDVQISSTTDSYFNGGNVGIGSASNHAGARVVINDTPPTAFGSPMFQVGQETFTASGYYSIGLGYTGSGYTEPPAEIAAVSTSSSGGTTADIVFGTRSVTTNTAVTERMRINSSGNVGIGTSSPSQLLHLSSTGAVKQRYTRSANSTDISLASSGMFNTDNLAATGFGWYNNGTEAMRIDSSGRVVVTAGSTVSPNMEINRTALSSGDGVLLNLECNNNSGTGNILRFTNDDPTITSGNHVGEIQFFSDDAGAPNSGLVASFQVVSENSSGDSAFTWRTGGTERMRIDSSGKVGIGTASPLRTLQIGDHSGAQQALSIQASTTGRSDIFLGDGTGSGEYAGLVRYDHASDFMSLWTASSESMRIDSHGDLNLGTSSSWYAQTANRRTLNVMGGSAGAYVALGTSGSGDFYLESHDDGHAHIWNRANEYMRFGTNNTERMRIDASGDVQIHGPSMLASSILSVDGSGETRNGVASKVNNNAYWSYVGINSSGNNTFYVYGDGDVENTNNSYGAISDERLKSNIVDASSQIDDIMAVQVRSYTLNETGATHIGVVAQELEASGMSGLVKENEDGMKSVKYSVLYMKAIKALQEAVTRIETLEAEVAALKGE